MPAPTAEDYTVHVAPLPEGQFTAADLGLSELEPHHHAYLATSPAWPDLSWLDATPDRSRHGLRMLIADQLEEHAAAGTDAPPAEPDHAADESAREALRPDAVFLPGLA